MHNQDIRAQEDREEEEEEGLVPSINRQVVTEHSQRTRRFFGSQRHMQYNLNEECRIPIVIGLIVFTLYTLFGLQWSSTCEQTTLPRSTSLQTQSVSRLPKIFWIYTENELQSEQMVFRAMISHLNQTMSSFGYEVRFVNSWTAYDWISNETTTRIGKVMQNNKIDEGVHNLLKFALLIQNGGILFNQSDTIIIGKDFKWIQNAFGTEGSDEGIYRCQFNKTNIYMQRSKKDMIVSAGLVAALPGSQLLKQALVICENVMLTGIFPQDQYFNAMGLYRLTKAKYFASSFQNCINAVLLRSIKKSRTKRPNFCDSFGLQDSIKQKVFNLSKIDNWKRVQVLKKSPNKIICLKGIQVLTMISNYAVHNYMIGLILGKQNLSKLSNESLLFKALSTKQNKRIFLQPLPERNIEICIVVMEKLGISEIKQMHAIFEKQTFKRWKLIVPVNNVYQFPSNLPENIRIYKSEQSSVRNIQIAICKHCDPKGYALLVHKGEEFSSLTDLEEIALALKPRQIIGAFISIKVGQHIRVAYPKLAHFNRANQGIVNPEINLMEDITNHMRIISVQSFRFLPQFDLRDMYGRYYNDRLIFLMSLLQMIYEEINQLGICYLAKKYSQIWNIPERAIILSRIVLKTYTWDVLDQEQLIKTRTKIGLQNLPEAFKLIIQWKIPFTKLIVLNDAQPYTSIDDKNGPDLIPKVIHQAWLGTKQLPPAKKYFLQKTKRIYPSYEVKLWRQENLTRQNFPISFQLMQTLIQFNKNSVYNKLATVTDIMRHELIYRQGGFWKDAGMNFLRPILDKFLKYKLVIPVDKTVRYRWLQGMCFFGAEPKLDNMWRVVNPINLNRMNIYHWYAISIAGPIDFRQFVIGKEEYEPSFLIMPFETFYPGQTMQHPEKDRCTKKKQQLSMNDKTAFVQSDWYLLENCDELYPHAYAIEHNRYGDSWSHRKGGLLSLIFG